MDNYIIDLWNNNNKTDIENTKIVDAVKKTILVRYIYLNQFDWERYHNSYGDLTRDIQIPDELTLYTHWINHGKFEGRLAKKKFTEEDYDEFEYKSYQMLNENIIELNEHLVLYKHWISIGMFDPKMRVNSVETIDTPSNTVEQLSVIGKCTIFKDELVNKKWTELVEYEIEHFNWKHYLNKYRSDLVNLSNITTYFNSFIHWIVCGKKEKRVAYYKYDLSEQIEIEIQKSKTYNFIKLSNEKKKEKNDRLTILPIYIINLTNRIDKKYEMMYQINEINGNDNVTIFRAYDHTNYIVNEKYHEYKSKFINSEIRGDKEEEEKEEEEVAIISNIGAMGLIVSTIELFKQIEESGIDNVIILEDDVQLHKSWNYMIKPVKTLIEDKDIVYIGFNNHEKKVNEYFYNYNSDIIENIPYDKSQHVFYGTYGYICSSQFRQKIIGLGIDWFITNNATLDYGYNILMWEREITGYAITGEHMVFPDIYDEDCINNNRKNIETFYLDRYITTKNYIDRIENDVSFVFIIPSYNNEKWIEKNIKSVINQKYKKWKMIYIDDNSSDNTGKLFKKYTKSVESKCTYIHNKQQYGQAFNRYMSYNRCNDKEYCVLLDGDDWLSHNYVLKFLSLFITNNKLDMTYGSYDIFNNNKIESYTNMDDYSKETIVNKTYRKDEWRAKHLRVIKASLLKMIDPFDFIDENGDFLRTSTDMIESFACLELSEGRHKKVDDVLMLYNQDNSKLYDTSYYNDNNKEFKMNNEKRIRNRQHYVKKQNDTVVVIDIEEENYKDKIMENTFKDKAILIAKGSELVHYVDRLMEYKNIQFVVD